MSVMYIPKHDGKLPGLVQAAKSKCEFLRYQGGKLWYRLDWDEPGELPEHLKTSTTAWTIIESRIMEFPVPVEDTGTSTFEIEMTGLALLRWIRQHVENLKQARAPETLE